MKNEIISKALIKLGDNKNKIFKRLRGDYSPQRFFHSFIAQRHVCRRLEHLASLGLDVTGSSVLEVGAGIGDLTSFFVDRGCNVVTSDARKDNLKILHLRYPDLTVVPIDLDNPPQTFSELFDIVFCYGLLYHLKNPAKAIEFMSTRCSKKLLLETWVSYGEEDSLNPCIEDSSHPGASIYGQACRPTRKWVHNQLKQRFEFVYMPITQPWHEEFPLNWASPPTTQTATRAIFVASRQKIINGVLTEDIPLRQVRH